MRKNDVGTHSARTETKIAIGRIIRRCPRTFSEREKAVFTTEATIPATMDFVVTIMQVLSTYIVVGAVDVK